VNAGGADGLLSGNASLLVAQLLAVGATMAFSALVTFVLLHLVRAATGLRSTEEHEHEGLDLVEHGEQGYHELS
jgi:Amt family ammonium transporter